MKPNKTATIVFFILLVNLAIMYGILPVASSAYGNSETLREKTFEFRANSYIGEPITHTAFLPLILVPQIITYTVSIDLLSFTGRGENWNQAWQTYDSYYLSTWFDASVVPSYDLEIPPVDYIIGRSYISIPVPEFAGTVISASLYFPGGCFQRNLVIPQAESYPIYHGTWTGLISESNRAQLWYPPPYNSNQMYGSIQSSHCVSFQEWQDNDYGSQPNPDIAFSVLINPELIHSGEILNLIVAHPQEGEDLRITTTSESYASIGSPHIPELIIEVQQ